jgi:hypothetical protein
MKKKKKKKKEKEGMRNEDTNIRRKLLSFSFSVDLYFSLDDNDFRPKVTTIYLMLCLVLFIKEKYDIIFKDSPSYQGLRILHQQ